MGNLVFTNGCFDILHPGHIRLLRFAHGFGHPLVVGINSDESVRRLKGPKRPIMPERDRLEMLHSIRWVDEVYVFDEDTPENIIKALRPAVLVKGPECAREDVPGAKLLSEWGGKLVIPTWEIEPGHSTSAIEGRILAAMVQNVVVKQCLSIP